MRGDGPDAVGRDIEGEVDRALGRGQGAAERGEQALRAQERRVLEHTRGVALGEVIRETGALEAARQSADEWRITRARTGLLEALDVYTRANAALRDAVHEHQQQRSTGGGHE